MAFGKPEIGRQPTPFSLWENLPLGHSDLKNFAT